MARKRLVSPKFFTHGELYDAEVASNLPLRLGYEALWCQADRRGLFAWRPRELKLQCLPYDPVDFGDVLDALERHGFLKSYIVDGKRYGAIETLKDHQSFHQAEKPDHTIPEPPPGAFGPRTDSAPPQHSAGTVPTPDKPEASSTVAVAVAVTGTTTTSAAGTVGDSAPGQPPGQSSSPASELREPERPPSEVPKIGVAFRQQYDELCAASLPYQRAALDAILVAAPMPDILLGSVHAIASGMHQVVSDKGEVAGIEHVLIAVTEAAVKFFHAGRPFDQRLFRGCVRSVVNRKPEPTTADQRAAEAALRTAAPNLHIERPRSPEEQSQADETRREAMRRFWLEAGRPDRAQQYETAVAIDSAAA